MCVFLRCVYIDVFMYCWGLGKPIKAREQALARCSMGAKQAESSAANLADVACSFLQAVSL